MQETKAVLFDLDGTLINTIYSLQDTMNKVMDRFGYDLITEEETKQFVGTGYHKFVEKALAKTADRYYAEAEKLEEKDEEKAFEKDQEADDVMDSYDDACDLYIQLFKDNCTYHLVSYPGMKETLDGLRAHGIKIACVTNKSLQEAEKCLDTVFGAGSFDYISADDGTHPLKPDTGVVEDVLRHFSVKAEECVFVGDTKTDMQTASNAGIRSIGCLYGFRDRKELEKYKADCLVENAGEILPLILDWK